MRVHLILKNIQGDFLAQISDVAGQVTIGSDPDCDLQIPDGEVKSEQLRFSYLNGDLWLQVPDSTEAVKIEDQEVREAKIAASTVVFFKDYFIEVLFKTEDTAVPTQTISSNITYSNLAIEESAALKEVILGEISQGPVQPEATRVVDPSMEKTRVATQQESPKFDESTRVVRTDEATRIVSNQEARRIVVPRAQVSASPRMRELLQKSKSRSISSAYETAGFSTHFKNIAEDFFGKIKRVSPLQARNIGFGVGLGLFMILVLFSFKRTVTEVGELNPPAQSPARENVDTQHVDTPKRNIQTVTKDFYLQELNKLFEK